MATTVRTTVAPDLCLQFLPTTCHFVNNDAGPHGYGAWMGKSACVELLRVEKGCLSKRVVIHHAKSPGSSPLSGTKKIEDGGNDETENPECLVHGDQGQGEARFEYTGVIGELVPDGPQG